MNGRKVAVAMSGGVDSSVAAAILKQQGYQVTGLMLRLWSEPGTEDSNRCCTPDAMAAARRVAAILDIPFYVIDAREVFRSTVVDYFLDGYGRGQTPNPCLVCNRSIRWTYLLEHALALGAECMATGHYVRKQTLEGVHQLLRSVDPVKDQSYVLHILDQSQLSRALFPIGDYHKAEIRDLADSYNLPTSTRKDSQDLCFLAGDDYRNFLARNAPHLLVSGEIRSQAGKLLGTHKGLPNYTIGQRKGLGFTSAEPMYVLRKDVAANTLIAGDLNELGMFELNAYHAHWISGSLPGEPFRAQVKIRYTAREADAMVTPHPPDRFQVHFDSPQRDITPGQAAVIYQHEVMLGGGIIV